MPVVTDLKIGWRDECKDGSHFSCRSRPGPCACPCHPDGQRAKAGAVGGAKAGRNRAAGVHRPVGRPFTEGARGVVSRETFVPKAEPGARGTSKEACPFHKWDESGRPVPPAGYCGPDCTMRP